MVPALVSVVAALISVFAWVFCICTFSVLWRELSSARLITNCDVSGNIGSGGVSAPSIEQDDKFSYLTIFFGYQHSRQLDFSGMLLLQGC